MFPRSIQEFSNRSMKRFVAICSLLIVSNLPLAAHSESIKQLDVTIAFDKSMKVKVVEDLTVDLGPEGKGEYIRTIPEEHFKGDRSAKEIVGSLEKDTTNRYESDGNGNVSLIIGAPGVVEKGIHTYRIVYESETAARIEDGKTNFTWDASGKTKDPIDKMSVLLSLPSGVTVDKIESTATKGGDAEEVKIEKTASFIKYKTDFVYPGQSFVVNATFPAEGFQPRTSLDKSGDFFDTTPGRVLLIVGVLMIIALAFSAMLAKRDHMH